MRPQGNVAAGGFTLQCRPSHDTKAVGGRLPDPIGELLAAAYVPQCV